MDERNEILARAQAQLSALQEKRLAVSAELDVLDEELNKINNFVLIFKRFLDQALEKSGSSSPYGVSASQQDQLPDRRNKGNGLAPNTVGAAIESSAVDAIRAAGHPLRIGQLLTAALEAGHHIGGARPATNLSSVLSRSTRVEYRHPTGWYVVEDGASSCIDDASGVEETVRRHVLSSDGDAGSATVDV